MIIALKEFIVDRGNDNPNGLSKGYALKSASS